MTNGLPVGTADSRRPSRSNPTGTAHRARWVAAPVVLVLALTTASCSGGSSDGADQAPSTPSTAVSAPPTTAAPLAFEPDPVTWEDCDAVYQCATLTVPLDWTDPDGATTDIAMVRVPAADPARRLGSLWVNPGGPGGTGIGFALVGTFPDPVAERFDLIGWDPRGVGRSSDLECGDSVTAWLQADPSPDDRGERRALNRTARSVAAECEAEDGDALPFLGADNEARDLEAMRIAVGEDRLNYLGYSYGTLIGERYAAQFPTHIRAMVLDGVVDPTRDHEQSYLAQAAGYEQGLDAIFASCLDDPQCPVDDPQAAFDTVAAAVEVQRLPGGEHGLGPAEFGRASFFATYGEDQWAGYLQGLADAMAGDGTALARQAADYDLVSPYTSYAAIWCADKPHPVGAREWDAFVDRVVAVAPRIGAVEANELRPCAFWPAEPNRSMDPVVAPGSSPILVVANTGDYVTVIGEARNVADTLEDGHLLTVEADQHTSGGIPCADAAVGRYLVTVEPPTEDC